jgi:hypothetical protein
MRDSIDGDRRTCITDEHLAGVTAPLRIFLKIDFQIVGARMAQSPNIHGLLMRMSDISAGAATLPRALFRRTK